MPHYEVGITRTLTLTTSIDVQAPHAVEAEAQALAQAGKGLLSWNILDKHDWQQENDACRAESIQERAPSLRRWGVRRSPPPRGGCPPPPKETSMILEHKGQIRCTDCGGGFLPVLLGWPQHRCPGWTPLTEEGLYAWAGWAQTLAQAAKESLGLSAIETLEYLENIRESRQRSTDHDHDGPRARV